MPVEEDTRAFIDEGFRRLERTMKDRPAPSVSPARTVIVSVIGVLLAGAIGYVGTSLIGYGERLVAVEVSQEDIKSNVGEVKEEVEGLNKRFDDFLLLWSNAKK